MGDGDELHAEGPELEGPPRFYGAQVCLPSFAHLLKTRAHQFDGERGPEDRDRCPLQELGEGADVVLVSVAQEYTAELAAVAMERIHARDDSLYRCVDVAQEGPEVGDDDILSELVGGGVESNLVGAPNEEDV